MAAEFESIIFLACFEVLGAEFGDEDMVQKLLQFLATNGVENAGDFCLAFMSNDVAVPDRIDDFLLDSDFVVCGGALRFLLAQVAPDATTFVDASLGSVAKAEPQVVSLIKRRKMMNFKGRLFSI